MKPAVTVAAVSAAFLLASSVVLAYDTPARECANAAADLPNFQPLRARAPIRFGEQTFATLTNATRASIDDQGILKLWAELMEYCYNAIADEARQKLPQSTFQILERDHTQFLILLADLYSGNITFGDFAKRRAELNSNTSSQIAAWKDERQRAHDQQAQQRAQEAAQANQAARNAAIGILMGRALAPAPAFVPTQPYVIPRPTTTNCTQMGNYTNCTTR